MDALQLTKELVSFASPSRDSNVEVSQFIVNQLRQRSFDVEVTAYTDGAGVEKNNVVARKGPTGTHAPGLAYFCHSDVVPADSWSGPGEAFKATEQDDRLYGRGSCDMKGSAACMLAAIDRLGDAQLTEPFYFVCTADEEVAYAGARQLVSSSPLYREMVDRQTRALIGEPTLLEVVYAHKGICTLRVISHGEAAHSSTRDGLNANLAMIPFLQEAKAIHDETESQSRWQNDEFDPPTISWNIGINDHTAAYNVKPAKSACTIFFRPLPGVDDQPLIQRTRQAAERHGLEFNVQSRCEAVYTPNDVPFVREALEVAERSAPRTVSYGTDGGELTELQNKIVCGPGSILQAHTADEWIAFEQLEKGTDLFERFVRRWCV